MRVRQHVQAGSQPACTCNDFLHMLEPVAGPADTHRRIRLSKMGDECPRENGGEK